MSMPAAGRHNERRPSAPTAKRAATAAADRHLLIGDLDRDGFVLDARKRSKFAGTRFERGDEKPILDVVTKSVEPDLARDKANLGGSHQPRRVVDDTHHPQGRG